MRLPNLHMLFKDDRMFVLHISKLPARSLERPWTVITIRNVPGYMPVRYDQFASREDALTYFHDVVVETPRVSLGNNAPSPAPSLEQYTSWLKSENLCDPLLNPGKLPS